MEKAEPDDGSAFIYFGRWIGANYHYSELWQLELANYHYFEFW